MGQFGWQQEAGQTSRGRDAGSCPLCVAVELQDTVRGLQKHEVKSRIVCAGMNGGFSVTINGT